MNFTKRNHFIFLKEITTRSNHLFSQNKGVSFKSAFSLDKIYPQSSLKLTTPNFVPEDPNAKFTGYIPMKELKITSCAASGPGGQHVNKVNTKVDVRFHVKNASFISEDIKEKLTKQYYNKINKDGFFVMKSDITRSQQLNIADALQKIRQIIRNIIVEKPEPDLETLERQRLRAIRAAQERIFVKRKNSQTKQGRSNTVPRDE